MNTMTYTCPRCNNPVESGSGFCPSCGAQMAPMYQFGPASYPRYAGFWIRVGAYIIDWFVLVIPGIILGVILRALTGPTIVITTDAFGTQTTSYNAGAELVDLVVSIGFLWAYFGAFWTTTGQTVGMKAVGIRVRRIDGTNLSILRSLGRILMIWVSVIPICLGLIWVAFQGQKRGWHDLACDTVVVHTR